MPGNGKHKLLYDGDCRFCLAMVKRWRGVLESRGFELVSLHEDWVVGELGLPRAELLSEMRVLTSSGEILGGVDAYILIWGKIWWCWPLWLLAHIPGARCLISRIYRWVAAHRYCIAGSCSAHARSPGTSVGRALVGWSPLVVLTTLVIVFRDTFTPGWVLMWALSFALFFGFKWLTLWRLWTGSGGIGLRGALAYLFLWPGMDARIFSDGVCRAEKPSVSEWLLPFIKTSVGAAILWGGAPLVLEYPLLAGWCCMVGLILILHFGLFALVAVAWKAVGVPAEPIMNSPGTATSLSLFWSKRWNRGFNELVHVFLFRTTWRSIGVPWAALLVFLASGLIHDLVISVPTGACYGLPTAYFLLQGLGVLIERSKLGRRLGLNRGAGGWLYMAAFTIGPAYWLLFPGPFVIEVLNPFFEVIGAL